VLVIVTTPPLFGSTNKISFGEAKAKPPLHSPQFICGDTSYPDRLSISSFLFYFIYFIFVFMAQTQPILSHGDTHG
jgi:hypothetical protein